VDPETVEPSPTRYVVVGSANERAAAAVLDAYDRHQGDLFRFAASITRDPAIAEDLVQESFARLLRETVAGRPPEQERAWLFRVCANLARSRARRARVAERFSSWLPRLGDAESPETLIVRHERDGAIVRAMADLSTDARTALLLAAQGFRGAEISALIGRSEGATRTLMFRARDRLRTELEGEVDR